MSRPSNPDQPRVGPWLPRWADQAAVAALTLAALGGIVGWWISQGGLTGRLIEVQRAAPQTAAFRVDVNSADWPELTQLPGIGEVLAKRIVSYRQAHGRFLDHQGLRQVRGIGPRTLERIQPYLLPVADANTLVGN